MFGALLIHLAVIATPATVANVATPTCTTVHCSATVNETAKVNESCAGAHCAPAADTAEPRYGGENLEANHDRAGLDAQNRRYGDAGVDHSFDNAHDASFDRQGYDRSGTWPAH